MWNIKICYGCVRSLTEAVIVLFDHEANEVEDGVSRAFVPHRVSVLHQSVAAPCDEAEDTEGETSGGPSSASTTQCCHNVTL